MKNALRVALICAGGLGLCACQTSTVRVGATEAQDRAMLGEIAQLAGEWEIAGEDGSVQPASVFAVTSAGSAVREVMFPGTAHEMTNVYHMDGQRLVMTHYCAAGNQPRMVASAARRTSEGTVYAFEFDSVSNLRESHDHYMGQMTLTIAGENEIRQEWRSFDRRGELVGPMTLVMRRPGG